MCRVVRNTPPFYQQVLYLASHIPSSASISCPSGWLRSSQDPQEQGGGDVPNSSGKTSYLPGGGLYLCGWNKYGQCSSERVATTTQTESVFLDNSLSTHSPVVMGVESVTCGPWSTYYTLLSEPWYWTITHFIIWYTFQSILDGSCQYLGWQIF